MRIGIIGAGIAGLASAVRMASRGYEVDVFEANDYPGGKLAEFSLNGYRFDLGPSLFTMPQYVDELFEVAGLDPHEHFYYRRLPVVCNYFWDDGTRLSAYAGIDAFAQEVADKLDVPANRVHLMLADSKRKYELVGRIFLEKSLHRLQTWTNPSVIKAMLRIPSFDLFTSMNKVHQRHLKHPKLVQLFNRFATYNGSNPYKAPGLLSIIPHFEHKIGAYYPAGGMYNITRSIYELAKKKGVRFHFNTPVQEIVVRDGRAEALQLSDRILSFDRIISNMDVFFTYRQLLPRERQPERILRQQKSTSAMIFYWGIKHSFPQLDLHNIFFSENYRAEFKNLEAGTIYEDPTVYINVTSKYTPDDAPEGCENWFTMVNVPFDSGQDWDALVPKVRTRVLHKLSRTLGVPVESLIACETVLTPPGIQAKTGSHLGALYGTSSNNRMAAFMRHANFSGRIQNLYFCGGSVHPGGGIPLCLLSAKIVDEVIHS